MKKLKPLSLNRAIALSLCVGLGAAPAWCGRSQGGLFEISKMWVGGSGATGLRNATSTLIGSLGEPLAGHRIGNRVYDLTSGYLAGYLGRGPGLRILRTQVGPTSFYQDGIQVGVPLDATVEVVFSDQLSAATLASGIQVTRVLDHLGRLHPEPVSVELHYDPAETTVYLTGTRGWSGNSLYEITLTSELQSIDGFSPVETPPMRFVSAVDPQQDNVVLSPITGSLPLALSDARIDPIEMSIPAQALSDFALALISRDPVRSPLSINPEWIQEANQKARQTWGRYGEPIAIREINVLDLRGQRLGRLAKSVSFGVRVGDAAVPSGVRKSALAIWALDETHRLWVKLPESHWDVDQQTLRAPVSRFAVFALIAAPLGRTADIRVFPNPWRPHGPASGPGAGQTGTEAQGITFTNLPSECVLRIFTLNGERVREIRHSDLSGALGQESWDGHTANGAAAASGVYLWQVESAEDQKTGKLMLIR